MPGLDLSAPLTAIVDFKDPLSYLAVAPTCALVKRLGIVCDWLPRVGATAHTRPTGAAAREDRGTRHRRLRGDYAMRDLNRYGPAGIDNPPAGDSRLLAQALLGVREAKPELLTGFVERAFDLVWRERAVMDDRHVIADMLADMGLRALQLEDEDTVLRAVEASLAEVGVLNAPAYVIEGEVFMGRAHLPMIEWIIGGRIGTGPI